jgi:hypothetical protein
MFVTTIKPLTPWLTAFVVFTALAGTSCTSHSGSSSPTSPSTSPPIQTQSSGNAAVTLTINPNPVPFSGQPITDSPGCAGLKNTWFYDQIFHETGGAALTLTSRVDSFDGFPVNNIGGLNVAIAAHGTATLHARWCSGNPVAHTAQTTFSGVDEKGNAVHVTTPTASLMAP